MNKKDFHRQQTAFVGAVAYITKKKYLFHICAYKSNDHKLENIDFKYFIQNNYIFKYKISKYIQFFFF